MSPNRRIALNFIATYGRSLFALVCGIFSGRWLLASLGTIDYGLWGCVGGLAAFVTFLNSLMAGAVSRFYAVSVGKANLGKEGLEECRQWFNIALIIHIVLSVFLVSVGYPMGIWAIRNYLTIPAERVVACVWVWRFTCVSCFFSMVNVPFGAMYAAKQEIAELTLYSVFQTLCHFILAAWMVHHPDEWLSKYAFIMCLNGLIPQLVILLRALNAFPECRICPRYFFIKEKFIELGRYVAYRFWGAGATILQSQGVLILVNKYVGPRGNASMTVGNTVASHTATLSAAMNTAIGPAIYNAYGAGDYSSARRLALQASKIGTLLYLLFVLPAAQEIHYLFDLWLIEPPKYAAEICLFIMGGLLTEKLSAGQVCAIYATGRIERFQKILCCCCLLGFVLAWFFLSLGWGIIGVGLSIIIFKVLIMVARGWYANKLFVLSIRYWYFETIQPVIATIVVCLLVGCAIKALPPSFFRLVLTTLTVEMVFIPMAWFFVLNTSDRQFVRTHILRRWFHR